MGSMILSMFGNLKLFLFVSWPFLLLIYLFVLRKIWQRWPLEAVILEKRGDNLIKTNDRVGKFFDKYSDMYYYKLKKAKDKIPVYNYDWILHNVFVPTNLFERFVSLLRGNKGTLFLFRYGSKQYKPINVKVNGKLQKKLVPMKDEKGEAIYVYQYKQFDPRYFLGVLDFEVIDWDNMNFMVQEQRASVMRRQKKGETLAKFLVPIIIIAAALVMGIFILKFSFDAGRNLSGQPPASSNEGSKILGAIQKRFTPGE